jgi:hypothetical protein
MIPKFSPSNQGSIKNLVQLISEQEAQTFKLSPEVINIAIELANSMSKETFVSVFSTFDEVSLIDENGPVCQICIDDLLKQISKDNDDQLTETRADTNTKRKCNCSWTCGQSPSRCTHQDCQSTSSGCGFLWLSPCYDRDELDARNCP